MMQGLLQRMTAPQLRMTAGRAAERATLALPACPALQLDCDADEIIFSRLQACSACCAASSEEQPEMKELNPVTGPQGVGYTVRTTQAQERPSVPAHRRQYTTVLHLHTSRERGGSLKYASFVPRQLAGCL